MFLVAVSAISNHFEIGDNTKLLQHLGVLPLEPFMLDPGLIVLAATITESIVLENILLRVLVAQ